MSVVRETDYLGDHLQELVEGGSLVPQLGPFEEDPSKGRREYRLTPKGMEDHTILLSLYNGEFQTVRTGVSFLSANPCTHRQFCLHRSFCTQLAWCL